MTLHFKSFDEMMELIEDKVVVTDQGSYIRVDDLKELNKELGDARVVAKKDEKPAPKGFAGAKEAAMQDPEFTKLFEPREPQAPAVGRDNNVPKETSNESVAAA